MEVTVVIAQAPFIVPVPSVGAPGTRHHGPHGSDRGSFRPGCTSMARRGDAGVVGPLGEAGVWGRWPAQKPYGGLPVIAPAP